MSLIHLRIAPATPSNVAPRQRYYSSDELRSIWFAADQLSPSEGGYVKLKRKMMVEWADHVPAQGMLGSGEGQSEGSQPSPAT